MNSSCSALDVPVLVSALSLPMLMAGDRVWAGFPSPAEDLGAQRVDLTTILITHPQATFLWRVRGDSMEEAGIADGAIIVVNRALRERHGDVVVATVDSEFTVKYLHLRPGRIRLKAANPTYPDIVPREGQTLQIWGVVTSSIKQFRKA